MYRLANAIVAGGLLFSVLLLSVLNGQESAKAIVRGTVYGSDGKTPVPAVTVTVAYAPPGGKSPSVVTDEHGCYVLALPPGSYELTVTGDRYACLNEEKVELRVGAELVADFEVFRWGTVTGKLVAPDGTPIANTPIRFQCKSTRTDRRPNSSRYTFSGFPEERLPTTDPTGRYVFGKVVPGERCILQLLAHGKGYAMSEPFRMEDGGTVTMDLKASPGGFITGRILDKQTGKPVEGAWVSAGGFWALGSEHGNGALGGRQHFPWHPWSLPTDDEGRFAVTVPPGEWELGVSKTGYEYGRMKGKKLKVGPNETVDGIQIGLEPARPEPRLAIAGRVVGKDGHPASGATVRLYRHSGTTTSKEEDGTERVVRVHWGVVEQARTDADGRFAFEARPDDYRLEAFSDEYAPRTMPLKAKDAASVILQLEVPASSISGVVRRKDTGNPIEGLEVFAIDEPEYDEMFPKYDAEVREVFGPRMWPCIADSRPDRHRYALTDKQGRYRITGLSAGTYYLLPYAKGYPPLERDVSVSVSPGQHVVAPDLLLDNPAKNLITGRLLKEDGAPLRKAMASLSYRCAGHGGTANVSGSLESDSQGRFALRMDKGGTCRITLSLGTYGPVTQTVVLEEAKSVENLDFVFRSARKGILEGDVFLPDGQTPAAGIRVVPFVQGRPWMWTTASMLINDTEYGISDTLATVTGANGAYRLELDEGAGYGVIAIPQRQAAPGQRDLQGLAPALTRTVEVSAGKSTMLFVRLARGATVSGKVLDAQGHALKDAKVSVSGFTGPLSHAVRGTEATTDGDGCYRLDGLPAGSISLRCSSKGFKAEHASDIPVQSGGEVANVDFVLQAAQPSRK